MYVSVVMSLACLAEVTGLYLCYILLLIVVATHKILKHMTKAGNWRREARRYRFAITQIENNGMEYVIWVFIHNIPTSRVRFWCSGGKDTSIIYFFKQSA